MKTGIKLIEIANLRAHEQVCPLRLAAAILVDYQSRNIWVLPRRQELVGVDLKKLVVETVGCNRLLPSRSTKHYVRGRIRGVKIKLERLK